MRDFMWNFFQVTGNIDAYLLYKDVEAWPENGEVIEEEKSIGKEE